MGTRVVVALGGNALGNTPEQQLSGYDEQLRTAVEEMLRAADAAKTK